MSPWWSTNYYPDILDSLPLVTGRLSQEEFEGIQTQIHQAPESKGIFLGVPALRRCLDDKILVLTPSRELAYIHCLTTGNVTVVGKSEGGIALSVTAIATKLITVALEAEGWIILHAGCVINQENGLLILGNNGSGKTTTSLSLGQLSGFRVLSSDRCFVRPIQHTIEVLALVQPITVGLSLLKSLGWGDKITMAVRSGTLQHPAQKPDVTASLRQGCYGPVFAPNGRERKYHLLADNLYKWFGYEMAQRGQITHLLFPRVNLSSMPQIRKHNATAVNITEHFISDESSNFLMLPYPERQLVTEAKQKTTDSLCKLPHLSVDLGSNPKVNAEIIVSAIM